jgi:hypothetical protein
MLILNNLLQVIRWIFHRPPKLKGKPIMIVPYLASIRDARQADIVAAQTKECSRLLAPHLYVWRRTFPQKPTLKTWNAADCCFTGMEKVLDHSMKSSRLGCCQGVALSFWITYEG